VPQLLALGNVVAGAVILPDDFYLPRLTDSKKLSAKKREILYANNCHLPILGQIAH
jgi:ribonuclease HII